MYLFLYSEIFSNQITRNSHNPSTNSYDKLEHIPNLFRDHNFI